MNSLQFWPTRVLLCWYSWGVRIYGPRPIRPKIAASRARVAVSWEFTQDAPPTTEGLTYRSNIIFSPRKRSSVQFQTYCIFHRHASMQYRHTSERFLVEEGIKEPHDAELLSDVGRLHFRNSFDHLAKNH
jgi:hypothetical protein